MSEELEMTEDQAEELVMGWQATGTLPHGRTRGSLANAYLILEARERRAVSNGGFDKWEASLQPGERGQI